MSLSIIIPTKDRGNVFQKTIESVCSASEGIQCEILVINDSKTSEIELGETFNKKITLLKNPKSGVASARNLGAKNAKNDYLLFLDDDILVNNENLTEALNYIVNNPDCALNLNWVYPPELLNSISTTSFGRYLIMNGFTSLKGWHRDLHWENNKPFNSELIASYFLMIKKSDFNNIGGYNEAFPHAGAEDFEFAKRLNKSNIHSIINPNNTVFHNESDRMNLKTWLNRKKRSAETRKIAVDLGYKEMGISTNYFKKSIALLLYNLKPVFYTLLKFIPNNKRFDYIYFKIINILITIHLYKGFFNSK